ncbi:hypothetical protein G5B30_14445 [Sphingobacterium sp. SGG-5]|uniref:hypothetical protein n=1 Tax=Sphingobacterium sp. SGG-5 TaxID=2710881 RepID=UPI0013E9C4DF|nr:hypothetical protein [Sphingobacterium sp. SGG-5]NGM63106.1 hypothetical protein [Sphingobacterium sp. SGG-5]
MKLQTLLLCLCVSTTAFGQAINLDGVYVGKSDDTNTVWLFKNGYSSQILFKDQEYLSTQGGPYQFDGKTLHITLEYNDENPQSVGTQIRLPTSSSSESLSIGGQALAKKPAQNQGLDGVWRITGRQAKDGSMGTIPRRDRKTIKILVDGYFQWIAINPAEKGFYGTGGGHYTFSDNNYTEHLLFFSRDNSRVGNTLEFKGEIKNKDWHHNGLSSKGDPIYEIWSLEP